MPERRYYAVRIGREGPKIYSNFLDFQMATRGLSGASGKGFDTYREAQAWLTGILASTVSVTQTTTTMLWDVSTHSRRSRTTVSFQTGARPYPEHQQGRRWIEYESPLNTPQARPNNDRPSTPPPPYVPLLHDDVLREPELPPPPPPQPAVELSEEQQRVLRLVQSGKNIFFTGPAGTGKSVLLRAVIEWLRHRFGDVVAVTAPTGIAGVNIGGSTIHSWAGIRLGKEGVDRLVARLGERARQRWGNTRVLVIDEVSMLDGCLFDKLEKIGRIVRENDKPFGGIQLVVSGDFFQLPPVPEQDSTTIIPATFAFDALSWSRCIDEPVFLTQVFRQKENKFVDMLSATRLGKLEDWHIQEFMKLSRAIEYPDGISPTKLFPLKSEVESCNKTHLQDLAGEELTYSAMDSRGFDMHGDRIPVALSQQLLDRLVVPKVIPLRVGAQVMLLKNLLQGRLVNGSLGKVVEFITTHEALQRHLEIANLDAPAQRSRNGEFLPPILPSTQHERFPLVKFTNNVSLLCAPLAFTVESFKGNTEAQRVQVPLVLAWAMSIHKAQGQTMSRVKVDLQRIFERGQAYVALSRATSLEGFEVVGFDPSRVMAHPRVIEWHACWQAQRDQDEEMDMDWAIEQYHSLTDISIM